MSRLVRHLGRWIPLLMLVLSLSTVPAPCTAQTPQSNVPAAETPQNNAPVAEYVVGPEDVLDIAVWNNPDITRTVPVRPDGMISLPLLNDVHAAGLTPMQLRDALARLLASYIPNPTVSVIVREVHSFKVTVIGEVRTPGRYELKSRATVLDVLAIAGGLTEFAARSRIVVLRQESGATREMPFAFDKRASKSGGKAGAQENFCVQPGDIIVVP
jgi:polysaccharide export outer membrane protein